jgi:hypothetical protein
MFINLNIQNNVDYYVMNNVVRPFNARGDKRNFESIRYVNTFLNARATASCAGAYAGARQAFPCPEGPTQPLNGGQAPPPLKPQHRGYSNLRLNAYFRILEEQNPKLAWNFKKAVYLPPTGGRLQEYMAMKCLASTYGGAIISLSGKNGNVQGLVKRVERDTQIIGILGHGLRTPDNIDVRGRIIIGRQHVIEDDQMTQRIQRRANWFFITNPAITTSFTNLGKKISPLAVIVLYHCYNGLRKDFLQGLADLVDRAIFAYTGFLSWHTSMLGRRTPSIAYVNKNWTQYKINNLIKQEFNYHPQLSADVFPPEGDWVVTIPKRFDMPIFDKLEKDFGKKREEFEKLEAGARPMS